MSEELKIPENLNAVPRNPEPLYARVNEEELRTAIYENYGMTSLLVVKYDSNFKQVWNAIRKFHLEEDLEQAK